MLSIAFWAVGTSTPVHKVTNLGFLQGWCRSSLPKFHMAWQDPAQGLSRGVGKLAFRTIHISWPCCAQTWRVVCVNSHVESFWRISATFIEHLEMVKLLVCPSWWQSWFKTLQPWKLILMRHGNLIPSPWVVKEGWNESSPCWLTALFTGACSFFASGICWCEDAGPVRFGLLDLPGLLTGEEIALSEICCLWKSLNWLCRSPASLLRRWGVCRRICMMQDLRSVAMWWFRASEQKPSSSFSFIGPN